MGIHTEVATQRVRELLEAERAGMTSAGGRLQVIGDALVRVLVMEDSVANENALAAFVTEGDLPYELTLVRTVAEARNLLSVRAIDVILVDEPFSDGTVLDLQDVFAGRPVILLVNPGNEAAGARLMRMGVQDCLVKDPYRGYLTLLPAKVENALRHAKMARRLKENEDGCCNLVENLADFVINWDADYRLTFANGSARAALGLDLENYTGLSLWDYIHPEDGAAMRTAFGDWDRGEKPRRSWENRLVNRYGDIHRVRWNILTDRGLSGEIAGYRGVAHDVTPYAEQESLLRDTQSAAHVGSWKLDLGDGKITWSEEAFRLYGMTPGADAIPRFGPDFFALHHRDDWGRIQEWFDKCLNGDAPGGLDFRTRPITGTTRWLLGCGKREVNKHGQPISLIGTIQDITERKHTETALQVREEQLRVIIETEPECVKIVGPNGELLEMNPAGLAMLEVDSVEEAASRGLDSFVLPEYYEKFLTLHERVMQGESGLLEFEIVGLRGTRRWMETHEAPIWGADGRVKSILAITRDVTARKLAETALRESEQRFRDLVSSTDGIVWEADARTFDFCSISGNAERLLGYPAEDWLKPGFWYAHIHAEDAPAAAHYCRTLTNQLEDHEFEYRFYDKSGRLRVLRDIVKVVAENGKPRWLRGLIIDVTAHKQAEDERRLRDAQLEQAFGASPIGMALVGLDGRFLRVNRALCHMLGWAESELTDAGFRSVADNADFDQERILEQCLKACGKNGCPMEKSYFHKDGHRVWTQLNISAVKDSRGEPLHFVFQIQDITERKIQQLQSENELVVLEMLAKGAELEDVLDRILLSCESQFPGIRGSVLLLDATARLRHGAAPNLPEAYCAAIDGLEIGPSVGSCGAAAFTGLVTIVTDIANDPLWRDYKDLALAYGLRACWSIPIMSASGRVLGTFGFYADAPRDALPMEIASAKRGAHLAGLAIERRQAETKLARALDILERTGELAKVGGWELDLQTNQLFWSQIIYQIYEINDACAPNMEQVNGFYTPESRPAIEAAIQAGIDAGTPWDLELPVITATGRPRWVRTQGSAVMSEEDGKAVRLIGAIQDITDRKCAELAFVDSEFRWKFAIEGSGDGLWDWDVSTNTVFFSKNWKTMLGYAEDEIGADLSEWESRIHPQDKPRIMAQIQAHTQGITNSYVNEHRVKSKDGSWKWILDRGVVVSRDAAGKPLRMIGTHHDLTERKRLEEQLRQSQKMEAIGLLAGGIAHDFNNLLTVINGYAELLLANLPGNAPQREHLAAIRESGARAAGLTAQLLAFSRKSIVEPKIHDLNQLTDSVVRLLRRLIGEDVKLETRFAPELADVRIDSGQFEQILINLAVNGRDAMPRGGTLTIATANLCISESPPAGPTDSPAPDDHKIGEYVELTVSDTGEGMTEEIRSHIFEPFFTTKGVGKGTGLGLATVYGFVRQADGTIAVESEPGRGTCFRIVFPAVADSVLPGRAGETTSALRGCETILLVEDEKSVRRIAKLTLEMQGYTVIEAETGTSAIDIAQRRSGPIHLLITDVVMPDIGGRDLADAVRAGRPEIAVLYMSGYIGDTIRRCGVTSDGNTNAGAGAVSIVAAFLSKPFTPLKLAAKVREVFNAAGLRDVSDKPT